MLRLGLHVMYNDDDYSYYETIVGGVVANVQEAGTYTVKFDAATDLSDSAKEAGITNMTKMTSIYLKDVDVTNGTIGESIISSGKIKYTSIKLNDTELTLTKSDTFDLVNASGVADSGGPINAWEADKTLLGEGDIEVTPSKYFSFKAENPTTIEITFELSDKAGTDSGTDGNFIAGSNDRSKRNGNRGSECNSRPKCNGNGRPERNSNSRPECNKNSG